MKRKLRTRNQAALKSAAKEKEFLKYMSKRGKTSKNDLPKPIMFSKSCGIS